MARVIDKMYFMTRWLIGEKTREDSLCVQLTSNKVSLSCVLTQQVRFTLELSGYLPVLGKQVMTHYKNSCDTLTRENIGSMDPDTTRAQLLLPHA